MLGYGVGVFCWPHLFSGVFVHLDSFQVPFSLHFPRQIFSSQNNWSQKNIWKKDTQPWPKKIPKDDFIGQRIYWLDLGKMMFNFKLILSFYVIALFFYNLWWDLTYWILCLLCAFWQMSPQLRIRTLDALNFTFQLICALTRNCIISTLSTYSSAI